MEPEITQENIAVIGMAGRFPGARNLAEFWRNLRDGVESLTRFSEEELHAAGVAPEVYRQPNFVPVAGVLPDADKFDAAFFGYTPNEAAMMDPQQRVFLETAWEALEDAGVAPESFAGSVGVFAGTAFNTYLLNNVWGNQSLRSAMGGYQTMLLNDKDFLTTRVSYKLNLKGPSVTVQTACSTSLVAVHQACQSLLNYQCDLALAGGVAIASPQVRGYLFQEGMILSPEGRCRPFDACAQGTVGGEGAGVVVLKRLSEALADGDPIDAVLLGTATNNDGSLKVGYTAPSVDGQAEVIAAAQAFAGVSPETIAYIETHGTGTALGDPIEIAGLTQAFRLGTERTQFCALGSLKSNIGHPDAAAGVAGLMKAILILKQRQMPPSLGFETPNPKIAFERTPFFVNTRLRDWEAGETPRRAGVSSFGIGGTNAHAVLEEAPEVEPVASRRAAYPLVFSAKTGCALDAQIERFAQWREERPDASLAEVAYTLATGRAAFPHRRSIALRESESLANWLQRGEDKRPTCGAGLTRTPKVAFLFPGQGAQCVGMGRALYETEAEFRQFVDECAEFLTPRLDLDLRTLLYPAPDDEAEAKERLKQTQFAQPALFVIASAMARQWQAWGVAPDAMLGHSVGEYVAAYLAGVFSREDALTLIATRGRLMQSVAPGSMLSVRAPASEIQARLTGGLALAADNAPSLCVVSGPKEEVAAFQQQLEAEGIGVQPLHTSHAFHSSMMEPILEEFRGAAQRITFHAPQIPYLSNRTATWMTAAEAQNPAYWAEHLRHTVRFSEGAQALLADPDYLLLEVGSGQTLAQLARQHLDSATPRTILCTSAHARNVADDPAVLAQTLGDLWAAGVSVDWNAYFAPESRRRVHLPTYPFERKRHWLEPSQPPQRATEQPAIHEDPTLLAPATAQREPANLETEVERTMQDQDALSSNASPRRERLLSELRQVAQEVAGIPTEQMHETADFFELGFDSLLLVQLSQAFQKRFGVKIGINQLMEQFATLGAVAEHLDSVLPPDLTPAPTVAPPANAVPNVAEAFTLPALPQMPNASNGSLPPVPQDAVERLIAQQLQVMQQQLAMLQGGVLPTLPTAPAPSAPKPAPTPTPVPSAEERQANETPGQVAHGPFRPVQKGQTGLTDAQRAYLDEFIERYNRKTAGSKRQTQRDRAHLADPRAVVGFRQPWKEIVYPIVATRSQGAKLWDVDGNDYVDLVMGFGSNLLGHQPPVIQDALRAQLERGIEVGPQSHQAGEVARILCAMTGMERAALLNTGSEAVMTALRLARAVTGRDKIALFVGAYHGNFDGVLAQPRATNGAREPRPIAAGIPGGMISDLIVLDYGDPNALEVLNAHRDSLAAVLVEPIQSRDLTFQPREFLQSLRRFTQDTNVALIFDDTVLGFRIHPRGSQGWFGVEADLATYGKVVGAGMPIGVIAGKAKYLDAADGGFWQYGDASYPAAEMTFYAGTFAKHPLTVAAAHALLSHLQAHGAELYPRLERRTSALVARLNALFQQFNAPISVDSLGSIFRFRYESAFPYPALFLYHLVYYGVHLWEGRNAFLSDAHTEEDIERIVHAVEQSLRDLQSGGFLTGGGMQVKSAALQAAPEKVETNPPSEVAPTVALNLSNDGTEVCPLTETQKDIWLAAQIDPEASAAYNETFALRFHGPLDVQRLEWALAKVMARHDVLRVTIAPDGETQRIHPMQPVAIPITDLTERASSEREAEVEATIDAEARQQFDLVNGPLVRFRLLRLAEREHLLLVAYHHIVLDGWSAWTLFTEWSAFYQEAWDGTPPELAEPMHIRDYLNWQAHPEYQQAIADAERYWVEKHRTPAPYLHVPGDRPRPAVKTYRSGHEARFFGEAFLNRLKQSSGTLKTTLFSLLSAGFQVFLHRLTGETDLAVGMVATEQAGLEGYALMGHCANLLPLRTQLAPERPFTDYLATVRRHVLEAFDHHQCVFGRIVRRLERPVERDRLPLVGVAFNLDRMDAGFSFYGLETENIGVSHRFVRYDLLVNVLQTPDELRLDCHYNAEMYDAATIQRLMGHFQTLMEAILENPDTPVSELTLLTPAEERTMLGDWNATQTDYPREATVAQLFEEQVARTPDAVALRLGDATLTYDALNRRANRLAHRLRALGIRPGDFVGVYLERCPEQVIAALAILKASGAYAPLEPNYPAQRLAFMLEDMNVSVVLTHSALRDSLPPTAAQLVCLDLEREALAMQSEENPTQETTPDSLAYVMYTSGSTGQPKGVCIPQRGVVRLVRETNYVTITPQDVFLFAAPFAFDASTFEIWGALLNGATLAVAPPGTPSLQELGACIAAYRVSILWLPAAQFHQVVEFGCNGLESVRQLLSGGDVVSLEAVRQAQALLPECTFINGYGPTENTTFSVCYRTPGQGLEGTSLPLGKPIANTQAYVLDANRQPVPLGVPGELYLGGDGLARGYLNRPDLTEEKFVTLAPFPATSAGGEGVRLYRTGDLVRWNAQGELEFLGRIDHQVKIRGFRIEPGEIEAALKTHADVREAAVTVWEPTPGDKNLVAYVQLASGSATTSHDLRGFLKERLPDYMVPADYLFLEAFPHNANGKIDRRALPSPSRDSRAAAETYHAPADEVERRLTELWQEELGVARVGVCDDFFDLGGNSLRAAHLFVRIEQEFGKTLPLATLFRASTVRELAKSLREEKRLIVAEPKEWDTLVTIQANGSRPPFFSVHAAGGNLLNYRLLSKHLGDDQPFYGFQAVGLDGKESPYKTVEDMATYYVQSLREVQPKGPYYLGGVSSGGVVAYEMAQQLHDLGEEVAILVMFDTYCLYNAPEDFLRSPFELGDRRVSFDWHVGNMMELSLYRQLRYSLGALRDEIKSWWKRRKKGEREPTEEDLPEQVREVRSTMIDAMYRYHPIPYPGQVTMFLAAQGQFRTRRDPRLKWAELAEGGCDLQIIACKHERILDEPYVGQIAARLRICIDRAAQGRPA